jgi:enediyne biosynthesis protein E4
VARGAAYADIDNDGDLDILVTTNAGRAYLFRNEGESNNSLRIKLVGSKSNRDGIGAVAHLTVAGMKEDQMLRSGSSYLSQSELVLTFGLGTHAKADAVEIDWPSGQVEKFSNVAGGQTVTIQEGRGVVGTRKFARRPE